MTAKAEKSGGKVTDIRKARPARRPATAPVNRRLGWTGLTEDELKREGGTFLSWLVQEANERGLQMRELATELGVTYGYISQLRTGARKVRHISAEVVDSAARFLGVPRLAVLRAAGVIRHEDLYDDLPALDTQLNQALDQVRADSKWAGFVPVSVKKMSVSTKLMIVQAYELATRKCLVPSKVELESVLAGVGDRDLITWLLDEADTAEMQLNNLAKELGVTYGYVHQLRSGKRTQENISDAFAAACARFLGVPRLAILLAAGRVSVSDFEMDATETLESQVNRAIRFIQRDPQWGPMLPLEALEADARTKQMYVHAYEQATGRMLVPQKVRV